MVSKMVSSLGFLGRHELKIDDKGRLTIPARFKSVLQEQCAGDDMEVVVNISLDLNLTVRSTAEFAKVLEEYGRYNDLDEETRRLQEVVIGSATQEKVDSAGRIRLDAGLRKTAGLKRAVTLVGMDRSFVVWDRERCDAVQADSLRNLKSLTEKVRAKHQGGSGS